ncbi:unnamed protein product [Fusarium graminearum]|nr:unnamed protein product [Fusarium graminearum]
MGGHTSGWTPINMLLEATAADRANVLSPTSTSDRQHGLASSHDHVSSFHSCPRPCPRPRPPPIRPPPPPPPPSPSPSPPPSPLPSPSRVLVSSSFSSSRNSSCTAGSNPPSPSAKKRAARYCYACEKAFNYKNFADHQKVHMIEGDSGARVKPCKQCAAKFPDGCRVAKKPDEAGTYACSLCLKSHKSCEYTALKRNIASWTGPCSGWAGRKHPKLIEHWRPWEL